MTYHVNSPGRNGYAVTPDDDNNLPIPAKSLYIGGAGDVKVTFVGGHTDVVPNHPVGYFPWQVLRVWETGTAATDIVAMHDQDTAD